jgi:hypothetical protein
MGVHLESCSVEKGDFIGFGELWLRQKDVHGQSEGEVDQSVKGVGTIEEKDIGQFGEEEKCGKVLQPVGRLPILPDDQHAQEDEKFMFPLKLNTC